MSQFAEWAKRERPDLYGDIHPDEIDRNVSRALSNPAERAQLLTHLRQDFKGFDGADDNQIVAELSKDVGTSTVEQLRALRQRETFKAGRERYQQEAKLGRQNIREMTQPGAPQSPTVKEKTEDFYDEVPHFSSVRPDEDLTRFPTYERWEDFEKLSQRPGHQIRMPGYGLGQQPIVTDGQGRVVGVLHAKASMDPAKVPGAELVPRLTGTGSSLQQWATRRLPGAPDKQGYGFREYGMDVGETAGAHAPEAMTALDKAYSYIPSAMLRTAQGIDEAEAWALQKGADAMGSDRLGRWAKENRKEAETYRRNADDVASFREYLDKASPEKKREILKMGGRYSGAEAGEWSQSLAPTEGTIALGAVGKVLAKPAGAVARWAGGTLADEFPNAMKWVSNMPSALGVGSKERLALKSAEAVQRNAGDVAERIMLEDMERALKPLYARHGIADEKAQDALMREVLERWHSSTARVGASPAAKEAFDVMQPAHKELFDYAKARGALPADLQYNPFHLYRGRDITRAARMNETAAAQVMEAVGKEPWQAEQLLADQVAHVPGVRAIGTKDIAPANMRPLAGPGGVADVTTSRLRASGRLPASEIESIQRDFDQMNALTGIVRSASAVLQSGGFGNQRAAAELATHIPLLKEANPESFVHISTLIPEGAIVRGELAERLPKQLPEHADGIAGLLPGHVAAAETAERINRADLFGVGRTAQGNIRAGDRIMPLATWNRLKDKDEVIIRVGKTPYAEGRGSIDDRHITLPSAFQQFDGMVVPRRFARAMEEMSNKDKAVHRARDVAQKLDRVFGLTQLRNLLTRGNTGFEWRNRTSEVARLLVDEGDAPLSREVQNAISAVAKAPLSMGSATVPKAGLLPGQAAGRAMVHLGGKNYDASQLHRRLAELGVIGKGISADALKENVERHGAGRIIEAIPGVGKAVNFGNRVAMIPGEASGYVANAAFRALFPGSPASAEDSIHLASVLAKMRRGVSVEQAAADTKMLFIDYSDKNAVEALGQAFVPFIKYYTGAVQGAFAIALKEPRRFAHVARLARAIEDADQTLHGGALDPRIKPKQEALSMAPMIQEGSNVAGLRPETPWAELVNLLAMAPGVGFDERGIGAVLSPLLTNAYAGMTGKDMGTGHSVLGMDKEEMKRAPWFGPAQLMQAFADQAGGGGEFLGPNPKTNASYQALKYLPLLGGRVMSPQIDMALRAALDVGSSPAARAVDSTTGMLQRAIPSALVGVRQTRIDPQQQLRLKAGNTNIPQPLGKQRRNRERKGLETRREP